jgi:hypothetical protein
MLSFIDATGSCSWSCESRMLIRFEYPFRRHDPVLVDRAKWARRGRRKNIL